jgi:hypothetical protein
MNAKLAVLVAGLALASPFVASSQSKDSAIVKYLGRKEYLELLSSGYVEKDTAIINTWKRMTEKENAAKDGKRDGQDHKTPVHDSAYNAEQARNFWKRYNEEGYVEHDPAVIAKWKQLTDSINAAGGPDATPYSYYNGRGYISVDRDPAVIPQARLVGVTQGTIYFKSYTNNIMPYTYIVPYTYYLLTFQVLGKDIVLLTDQEKAYAYGRNYSVSYWKTSNTLTENDYFRSLPISANDTEPVQAFNGNIDERVKGIIESVDAIVR